MPKMFSTGYKEVYDEIRRREESSSIIAHKKKEVRKSNRTNRLSTVNEILIELT
jgi:hypothetical protein